MPRRSRSSKRSRLRSLRSFATSPPVIAAALVIAAGLAAFANSFDKAFVFDGVIYLTENPVVRQLWPLDRLLSEGHSRPLTFLTFGLNYAFDGYRPLGWQIVNLTIHLFAALVLLDLLRRTLELPRMKAEIRAHVWPLATAATLLWVVHPLQTQSVTYIYQRSEALAGLCYLLTLDCVLRAAQTRSNGWAWAAVASCAAGMLSKETMATAPLAALWFDRVFLASSWREIRSRRFWLYVGLASTWLILGWLVVTHWNDYLSSGLLRVKDVSPWEYARSQSGVVLHYLRLAFWPVGQCLDYGWPVSPLNARTWIEIAVVGLMLLATAWCAIRRPAAGFLAGMFFLVLAPTTSVIPARDLAFEHRMYLPLACIATAFVLVAKYVLNSLVRVSIFKQRMIAVSFVVVLTIALAATTHLRNRVYESSYTAWSDTVAKAPRNSRAHANLGMEQLHAGRKTDALAEFEQAVELDPEYYVAWHNLALAHIQLGQFTDAVVASDRAIAIDPDGGLAYGLRAVAHEWLGRSEAALADFTAAVERDPDPVDALGNRATLYAARGQLDLALADRSRVIGMYPERAASWQARGMTFLKATRSAEALSDFSKARDLDSTSAEAWFGIGAALQQMRRQTDAVAAYDQALRLHPTLTAGYAQRAACYLALKRYAEAWDDVHRFQQLGGTPDPGLLRRLAEESGRVN